MRLIHRLRRRIRSERGFTMATTMIGGSFMGLLAVVAATAAKGDLNVTQADLEHKQAYEAARAGLADYAFHLNQDTNYWTRCTNVPEPSAVNQLGSQTKRRPVPGSSGAEYAIELVPATGQSQCSESNPTTTMLEGGENAGTFRIRSTGYADGTKTSIVATFKRASFLDYLYFTQLETSDPVTYPNQATIDGAYQQCTKTVQGGRYSGPIPNSGGRYCDAIYFIGGETVAGPLHTNDAFLVCSGSPTFGRTTTDSIEVSASPPGWYACNSSASPNFVGTFVTNAPVLTPPPTNQSLKTVADPAYRFTGQTKIVLNSTSMTVTTNDGNTTTKAYPDNGVIYISNASCSSGYNPFTASYPATSGCGNVYVRGTYSAKLTIAAENDVIVDDDLIRQGTGLLGLVANNFVRVYHPYPTQTSRSYCGPVDAEGNPLHDNGPGSQPNLRIDAAILAIQHSFIVDHYNCGSLLGTLTVNGAIAQKFRGAVGTFGNPGTGYRKIYAYDDRLRYISPPHFLDPVESAWSVQRETID